MGTILTFGGFLSWYSYSFLASIFFIFVGLVLFAVISGYIQLAKKKENHVFLVTLFFVWSLHLLQVFVPETGFDALWYHLPVADAVVKQQQFIYIPDVYQSVNPLFADAFFYSGYAVFAELGTKIIAFGFALLLLLATYNLSRHFLSEKRSLQLLILVSLFQVVAWQASSFYVDLAKAFFEISVLVLVFELIVKPIKSLSTRQLYIFSFGLSVGAVFGTKLFSILLLPIVAYFIYRVIKQYPSFDSVLLLLPGLSIPLFYYNFAYQATGNPFYSIFHHVDKLQQIGTSSSLRIYLSDKFFTLPLSFVELLTARDYVYPLIAFIPLAYIPRLGTVASAKVKILLYFATIQWLVWWFVPPLSTRYAISGFIVWLVLGILAISENKNIFINSSQKFISLLFWISIAVLVMPRLIVASRSIEYLTSLQSTREYLEQFYDGSIDEKITDWYSD